MTQYLAKIPFLITYFFPILLLIGAGAADIGASFVAIFFLGHSFYKKEWRWLKSAWVRIALIFWFYLVVTNLFADDLRPAFISAFGFIRFVLFAIAIEFYILKETYHQKKLLLVTSITLGFVILDSYFQFFMGFDFFGVPQPSPDRLSGPIHHPRIGAYLNYLMYPSLVVGLKYFWGPKWDFKRRFLSLFLVSFCILPIILSGERVQIPLLFLGFFLLALFWEKERRFLFSAGILIIVTGITIGFLSSTIRTRIIDQTFFDLKHGKENHYIQIWSRSIEIFKNYPFFGVGINNFKVKCKESKYGPQDHLESRCGLHPHHFYIELLVETGLIGFSLMFILLFYWCKKIVETYKLWKNNPLLIGLVISFVLSFWPFLPTRSFFNNWREALLWFMTGWLLAIIRQTQQQKIKESE